MCVGSAHACPPPGRSCSSLVDRKAPPLRWTPRPRGLTRCAPPPTRPRGPPAPLLHLALSSVQSSIGGGRNSHRAGVLPTSAPRVGVAPLVEVRAKRAS